MAIFKIPSTRTRSWHGTDCMKALCSSGSLVLKFSCGGQSYTYHISQYHNTTSQDVYTQKENNITFNFQMVRSSCLRKFSKNSPTVDFHESPVSQSSTITGVMRYLDVKYSGFHPPCCFTSVTTIGFPSDQ